MDLVASPEANVDYEETARLATAAFASSDVVIRASHLRWLYERCFLKGATVIALRHRGEKVGHFAMVRQTIRLNGVDETAAQLVDLCILKDYRGRPSLTALYAAVEQEFVSQDIRFAIGMPNRKAGAINEHFFGLNPFLKLPIHVGVPWPALSRTQAFSMRVDIADRDGLIAVLSRFQAGFGGNGLAWSAAAVAERLSGPDVDYGIHVDGNVLVVSSPRFHRGLRYALICCILVGDDAGRDDKEALRSVVRSACRMWGTTVFVYAGVNGRAPFAPGIKVPDRLRPSPMTVQIRDFKPDRPALAFDRYELIDFDFA